MPAQFILTQYENIPCWYDLSFDEKTPAILIKVHRDILSHLPSLKECRTVKTFMKNFGFSSFSGDFLSQSFGFEDAFQKIGEENSFIIFSAEIPVLEKPITKKCSNCCGSGQDLFGVCSFCKGMLIENEMESCWFCKGKKNSEDNCYFCNGSGKKIKTIVDWHSLHAVSATFTLFFDIMFFAQDSDKSVTSDLLQLILVQTFLSRDINGAPLSGIYSIPLVNWLSMLSLNTKNTRIVEVENAMKITHNRIFGRFDDIDKMNIWAEVNNNGRLNINCPGDRACLFPSSYSFVDKGKGYEFACHNIDTAAQQLTLLAGLAALCSKARKEIK